MPAALDACRPVTAADGPPLVRRGDVPPSVWTGMLLDGALEPLWDDVAICAGHEVTAALRLAALAALVPPRGVVARSSAAWVHAGGTRPEKVDVLVDRNVRRTDPHPRRRPAEGPLPDEDVLDLGTGRVTTVLRTGLDIARFVASDEARPLLVGLLNVGLDLDEALAALSHLPGERGVLRARDLLTALRRGWPAGPGSWRP